MALCGLTHLACVDPSRMFTGRWVGSEALHVGDFSGYVELGIGQFGPELVGVMRRYDLSNTPLATCACSVVESRVVRIGEGSFIAVSSLCGEGTYSFEMQIDLQPEDARLDGTVSFTPPGGTSAAERHPLSLERLDDSVSEGFKACGE